MNLQRYLATRAGALHENALQRGVTLGLVVIILVLSFALTRRDVRIELVPSPLAGTTQLSAEAASGELKLAWGLSIVNLIGNVSPRNAPFLQKTLPSYFAPQLYAHLIDALEAQAKQIGDEQLSVRFIPTSSRWDEARQRVVISGDITTSGVRGSSEQSVRTYELGFTVRDYRVLVDAFDVYEGAPKSRP
jgi:conjugal transfer pilus assembly protein TraE